MTTHTLPAPPLVYEPAYEALEPEEADTTQALAQALQGIASTVASHAGQAFRSVHAQSHGVLQAQLQVLPVAAPYAQGMFAAPASYAACIRLSTTPGDLLPDAVSTPRGLALKVYGVDGARNSPDDGLHEQDWVFINQPLFSAASAKKFLRAVQLVAPTTDRVPQAKVWLSGALRTLEGALEKIGSGSTALKALGGHPASHPLADSYFTQVPVLYGPHMAKLRLVPLSAAMQALQTQTLDLHAGEHPLRDAVQQFCSEHAPQWALQVQLCTDIERMPLEDASVAWPEELSPWVTVAQVQAPAQVTWDAGKAPEQDDALRFNPWNGLAAHRPLGAIMRVRRLVYAMSAQFRQDFNAGKL